MLGAAAGAAATAALDLTAVDIAALGNGFSLITIGERNYTELITVNGAIDSESTARQIVEILNDSSARGTLGAGAFDR